MVYQGSCHCGRVAFEVEGTIDSGMACNCSICSRKGSLLWFVPGAQFKLATPEADTRSYTFHKHEIRHRFCPQCGIHPYADGKDPQGQTVVAVNLRCLEGVDLKAIPVHEFDGRAI